MIRRSHRAQGGPFPGKGCAPEMKRAFRLVDDTAAFERLTTGDKFRRDVGSLKPANDNNPATERKSA